MFSKRHAIALLLFITLASVAHAGTILSVVPEGGSYGLILGPTNGNDTVDIQFYLPRDYVNVSLSAWLRPECCGYANVQFFLTDQVGLGTTPANEIAPSQTRTLTTFFVYQPVTAFSGLSLDAGTYHFVLSGVGGMPSLQFSYGAPSVITADPGVTYSYGREQYALTYEPATTFTATSTEYNVMITGDVKTPEPGTFALLGLGVAALVLRKRWGM